MSARPGTPGALGARVASAGVHRGARPPRALVLASARVEVPRDGLASLRLVCHAGGTRRVWLKLLATETTHLAGRSRTRTVVLGSTTVVVSPGEVLPVPLRVSAKALSLIRAGHGVARARLAISSGGRVDDDELSEQVQLVRPAPARSGA